MTLRKETAELTRGAVARLARRLRVERPADSLSSNKVGVLSHLHRHGPSSPGEIAAAEHQQPQSLTRVFADLEAEGLVVRRGSSRDRRESVLDLTESGRAALLADMAVRDRWLASAIAHLTEPEAQMLRIGASLMEKLTSLP